MAITLSQLLILRIKQFGRMVHSIGWFLFLIALLILCGILFRSIENFLNIDGRTQIAVVSFFVLSLHAYRADKLFLDQLFPKRLSVWLLYAIEYFLIVSPYLVYLIFSQSLDLACALILSIGLLSVLPSGFLRKLNSKRITLSLIPIQLFEVKIAIERYWYMIVLLLITSFLGYLNVAWFLGSLFFILTILITGFGYNENLEIIRSDEKFLVNKLAQNLGFICVLVLVQFCITIYFHSESWLLLIYGMLYLCIMVILAIVFKYAKFNPLFSKNHSFNFVIFQLYLSLLPGFILGAVAAAIFYYFKAEKRIKELTC